MEVTYNQGTGDAVLIYTEGPDGSYATEPLERVEDAGPSDPYRLMDRWNNGLVDPPFYHDSSSRDPPDFNVDDLDFS